MRRRLGIAVFGMLGLTLGVADGADAQLTVGVHVDWQWSDAGHRARYDHAFRAARLPRVSGPRYAYLYHPVTGIRIPRGHRPRAGFCRLWYPGVAPGLQPPAVPCGALRGRYRPGVLVVTWQGVLRPAWDGSTARHWRGYRDVTGVAVGGGGYRDRDGDWWDDRGRLRGRRVPRLQPPGRGPRAGKGKPGRWKGERGRWDPGR